MQETPYKNKTNKMSFHYDQLHTLEEKVNKRPYKCPNCDASFAQRGNLKVHISGVHEGKKPYKCPNCDSRFAQNSSLQYHISSVHEEKNHFNRLHAYKVSFQLEFVIISQVINHMTCYKFSALIG